MRIPQNIHPAIFKFQGINDHQDQKNKRDYKYPQHHGSQKGRKGTNGYQRGLKAVGEVEVLLFPMIF